ncbi:MAG: hypothetical protein ACP5XB_11655, partial [Isosphaeraceae bacterium]
MHTAALPVLLTLLGQAPGPIDAFRANYTAIKVDMDVELWDGENIEPAQFARARARGAPVPEDAPKLINTGRWGCDGSTEYFLFGPPEEVLKAEAEGPPEKRAHWITSTEGLYDGSLYAFHFASVTTSYQNEEVNVQTEDLSIPGGAGPFLWWMLDSFPKCLDIYVPGAKPERRTVVRDGRRFEVEVYEGKNAREKFRRRVELWYDPSIGYLPRYAREMIMGEPDAGVDEVTLIEARSCAAGGFVPTRWYRALYNVKDLAKRYPKYDVDTVLEPTERGYINYFKATNLRDRTAPVALDRLKGVTRIASSGGSLLLAANTHSLTMHEVIRLLGRMRGKSPAPALPDLTNAVDADEVRELDRFTWKARNATWTYWIVGGLVAVLILLLALRRKMKRAAAVGILFATVGAMHGCGKQAPVVKLTADFPEKFLVYDPGAIPVEAVLRVQNVGNCPLRLARADGGCSCRHIDQSLFPAVLPARASLDLKVGLRPQPGVSVQPFPVSFETDHGTISVSPPAHLLATHQLSPNTMSLNLEEDQETG